jgi:hypothetical protein
MRTCNRTQVKHGLTQGRESEVSRGVSWFRSHESEANRKDVREKIPHRPASVESRRAHNSMGNPGHFMQTDHIHLTPSCVAGSYLDIFPRAT